MEEEEIKLIEEEKILEDELKLIQDKHKDVKLVYEKIVENIKTISKSEKKNEEIINTTNNINTENNILENEDSFYINKTQGPTEDQLFKVYSEYLDNTKYVVEKNFLSIDKEKFENNLREKEDRLENLPNQLGIPSEKVKGLNTKKILHDNKFLPDPSRNRLNTNNTNFEYDYSDEELKEDDRKIKEEYNQIAAEYKKTVIFLKSFFI